MNRFPHHRGVWIMPLIGCLILGCTDAPNDSRRFVRIAVDQAFWDRLEAHLLKDLQEAWDREQAGQPATPPDAADPFAVRRPEGLPVKNHRELLELAGVPFSEDNLVLFLPHEGPDGVLLVVGDDRYHDAVKERLRPFLPTAPSPGED